MSHDAHAPVHPPAPSSPGTAAPASGPGSAPRSDSAPDLARQTAPGPAPDGGSAPRRAPGPIPVRRRDRAVEDEAWLERFLLEARVGVLALPPAADGAAPHLNANLFAFDADAREIVLHTARTGATPERSRGGVPAGAESVPAAFHAFAVGRVLPADRALEFSIEYAGVTATGPLRIVRDPDEAKASLALLMERVAPHLRPERDYEPATDEDLRRTAVYRLRIERWSGKRKVVEEGFPGAYVLPVHEGWRGG